MDWKIYESTLLYILILLRNELIRHRLKCLYMAKKSQAHLYFNDRPRQPLWRNSCRESGDSRELSYFDIRSGRREKRERVRERET